MQEHAFDFSPRHMPRRKGDSGPPCAHLCCMGAMQGAPTGCASYLSRRELLFEDNGGEEHLPQQDGLGQNGQQHACKHAGSKDGL